MPASPPAQATATHAAPVPHAPPANPAITSTTASAKPATQDAPNVPTLKPAQAASPPTSYPKTTAAHQAAPVATSVIASPAAQDTS